MPWLRALLRIPLPDLARSHHCYHLLQLRSRDRATSSRRPAGPWRGLGGFDACAARTRARGWSAPPTRRRGREAWAPGRSVRPRPGPRLQLARDLSEPGATGRNRAGISWELEAGDGPGGGGPRSGCRGDGTVTPLEGGSEKVAGVPGRVGGAVLTAMGGSGSRLSKDLLAEYQVRGTRVPESLRAGVRSGAGSRSRRQGGRGLREAPLNPFSFCLPGPDVPHQAGDPPVSAVPSPLETASGEGCVLQRAN